ncbi:MAG: zinc ribbon domain-containing protein [candidate division WOR-3 bacterium]
MPTYEYECETCHHKFEEFQKITDKPLKKCPQCGNKVRRLISAGAGLIFKGSGFYITDYKRQNQSYGEKMSTDKKETPDAKTKSKD